MELFYDDNPSYSSRFGSGVDPDQGRDGRIG